MSRDEKYDEIGPWSEVKLEIIRKYAAAYSTILNTKKLHYVYIDAFAGAGVHISKSTRDFIPGSPLNALQVDPPFEEYHLIDLDSQKIESLREIVGERQDVYIYEGDCNQLLLTDIFPRVRYEDYRRALCLLDPYGLHLNWEVIQAAAKLETIDIFLNFPVADMNRNVLWRIPEKVDERQIDRMNAFWGDDSWNDGAYNTQGNLFGFKVKEPNEIIARAFQQRLREVAGFPYVPEPMPMRNSNRAVVYYLFFATHKQVAAKIANDIFKKYR